MGRWKGAKVQRCKGAKVERWKGAKVGRSKGGKVRTCEVALMGSDTSRMPDEVRPRVLAQSWVGLSALAQPFAEGVGETRLRY